MRLPLPSRPRRHPQARGAASAAFAPYWQAVVAAWPHPLGSQAEAVLAPLYDRDAVAQALTALAPTESEALAALLEEWRHLPPAQLQATMGGLQILCLLTQELQTGRLPEVIAFLQAEAPASRVRFLQFLNLYLPRGAALQEVMASWENYRELPLDWVGEVAGVPLISSLQFS